MAMAMTMAASLCNSLKPSSISYPSSRPQSIFPLSAPGPTSGSTTTTHFPFSSSPVPSALRTRFLSSAEVHAVSRRLFLPSVSGIWDALTGGGGGNNARDAVLAIRRGMLLFRQGDVEGSLVEFDRAMELDPRQKAYLWQRGLSLYYLNRFEEGAEQFRIDVAQNPNDTEESIWCFLCEAQLYGVDDARKRFLQVGRDPRPVMREAYNMFKDGGDPEKFVAPFLNSNPSEYFYATLYAGLYYESEKKTGEAKQWIIEACRSPYGERSDDYMASLAKVHCLCRDWTSASQ